MGSVFGLLVVVFVTLVVIELNVEFLKATDLAEPVARFQSWSLLTGAGFTTRESELVVNHPIRRRLALAVMITGALGVVGVVAGVVGTFVTSEGAADVAIRSAVVVVVVVLQVYLLRSRVVHRLLRALVRWRLKSWADRGITSVPLVALEDDRAVVATALVGANPFVGETVAQLGDRLPGVSVLGVRRTDGTYLSDPHPSQGLEQGDVLIVHGPESELAVISDSRPEAPGRQMNSG